MNKLIRLAALVVLTITAACNVSQTATTGATLTARPGTLTLYATATAPATPTPPDPSTPTPLPTSTATPRTHTVKAGEDMFGIALRYRVKLDELKAANPTVDPRFLKIGAVLIIPGAGVLPAETAVAPTTAAIMVGNPDCQAGAEGGVWCFVLVQNNQTTPFENVTVRVRLVANGKQIAQQVTGTLLDLLPAGASMPVTAYFAPPLPVEFQAGAELVSALPASEGGKRYVLVNLYDLRRDILPGGLTAEISGEAHSQSKTDSAHFWVAAVAFDAAGHVVGARRWESSVPLKGEGQAHFGFWVYSTGKTISRVEILAEARP